MSERIDIGNDADDCDDAEHPVKSTKKAKKSDFMKITGNLLSTINYKVAFLLFIIGIIIFSDVFIETVLSGFGGSVNGDCTTTKGTMLQLLFMVIGYIILDLIVQYEVL